MQGLTLKGFFSIDNSPRVVILFLILIFIGTNFTHHNWTRDDGPIRGVIKWDIISFYGYLPATFIYGDPSLDFLDEGDIDKAASHQEPVKVLAAMVANTPRRSSPTLRSIRFRASKGAAT